MFIDRYRQPLNVPNRPFLTASLSWGSSGEICYQQSNNLSLIERYLELNDDRLKNNIGYYETDWTLLIFYWNNITIFRQFDVSRVIDKINIQKTTLVRFQNIGFKHMYLLIYW